MADHRDHLSLDHYIDERLRDYRPDRYQPGDPFLERVADGIPDKFYDLDELLRNAKKADVQRRETRARRNANRLLREFHATGQLELHWRLTANEPLAVIIRDPVDDGAEIRRQEYVTLRAVTSADLQNWANNEEGAAQEDYEKRIAAVSGARAIAADMEALRLHRFLSWAEVKAPDEDHPAA